MLVIRDTSVPPFNGWQFPVQATNHTVSTRNYSRLYPEIVKHCQVNNVPSPTEQEVIAYLCQTESIPCYEAESRSPLINAFTMGLPNPPRLGGCCS